MLNYPELYEFISQGKVFLKIKTVQCPLFVKKISDLYALLVQEIDTEIENLSSFL